MARTLLRSAARALYRVLALSAFLTLALASVALADDVTNRIDTTVDATPETITLNEGASQSVIFRVAGVSGDGESGGPCNFDAGEQLVAALSSSNTSVATLSPQALTFTACNVDQSTTVTAGARGTATVTAAEQSNTTGTGTYNYAPASFSVTVNNVPPTISNIADQTTNQDTPTGAIPFTVGDAGTPANGLTLTASSDNQALVPNLGIAFDGSGANRTLTITPASGLSGTATITVSVRDDGGQVVADTFVLTVNAVDAVLPTVSRSAPGGVKVAPTAMVTAKFSEPMNEASVETPGVFTLKKGTKTIPATVTYNPVTQTATLDPTKNLLKGATYTATVLSGAKDLAGNSLAAAKVWTFKIRL